MLEKLTKSKTNRDYSNPANDCRVDKTIFSYDEKDHFMNYYKVY